MYIADLNFYKEFYELNSFEYQTGLKCCFEWLILEEHSKLFLKSMDAASGSSDQHPAYACPWRVSFQHPPGDAFLTVSTVVSCAKLCDGRISYWCQCNQWSENSNFHVENVIYSNGTDQRTKFESLYSMKSQWKFLFFKNCILWRYIRSATQNVTNPHENWSYWNYYL